MSTQKPREVLKSDFFLQMLFRVFNYGPLGEFVIPCCEVLHRSEASRVSLVSLSLSSLSFLSRPVRFVGKRYPL